MRSLREWFGSHHPANAPGPGPCQVLGVSFARPAAPSPAGTSATISAKARILLALEPGKVKDVGTANGGGLAVAVTKTRSSTEEPRAVPGFSGPAPTLLRSRNVPGAVLGVLVVAVCSLAVASLASSASHRTQVLVVIRPVAAGSVIRAGDLRATGVAADGSVRGVRASQAATVVGQVAADNLLPGTLLVDAELAREPVLPKGSAIVGLALKPGFFPAGLTVRSTVEAVATPIGTSGSAPGTAAGAAGPSVLIPTASVFSVGPGPDGAETLVSIVVPSASAALVAQANALGAVSLVVVGG